nr:MAG TPA: hypothetical protein [Caudoviricetes sp.]
MCSLKFFHSFMRVFRRVVILPPKAVDFFKK